MTRFVCMVGCGLAALIASTAPSLAGFQLCNHSKEHLSVAIGLNSGEFGWTSAGWWNVEPNACEMLLTGDLDGQYYYIYAEGDRDGVWSAPKGQDGGFFCVKKGKFTLHNSDFQSKSVIDCEANDATTKQFITVNTKNATSFEYDLEP